MRAAFFIVYLFSFFLKGNHYVLEPSVQDKVHYSQTFEKNQRSKFVNPDQGTSIDENADLDEEDFHSDDLSDDAPEGSNPQLPSNFILPQDWFFSIAGLYFQNLHTSYKAFAPCISDSSPIYIIHRVLRI